MEDLLEELVLPALREIREAKCGADCERYTASGTGRLLRFTSGVDHWYLELCCSYCGDLTRLYTRRIDVLVSAIQAVEPSQRDAVARAWVAEGWEPRWLGTHWG